MRIVLKHPPILVAYRREERTSEIMTNSNCNCGENCTCETGTQQKANQYECERFVSNVLVKLPPIIEAAPKTGSQYNAPHVLEVLSNAGECEEVNVPECYHVGHLIQLNETRKHIVNKKFYGFSSADLGTMVVADAYIMCKVIPAHQGTDGEEVEERRFYFIDFHKCEEGTKAEHKLTISHLMMKNNPPMADDIRIVEGWSYYFRVRDTEYTYKCTKCGNLFTSPRELKGRIAEKPMCVNCRPAAKPREEQQPTQGEKGAVTQSPMTTSLADKVTAEIERQRANNKAKAERW